MIRVVIVDDQPLARAGVEAIVAGATDMLLVGSAEDGASALPLIAEAAPDVALVDLRMPGMGGVELIRALRDGGSATRVVVLTTFDGDPETREALSAGAAGFLGKASEPAEILDAVRVVSAQRAAISERALRLLADASDARSSSVPLPGPAPDPELRRRLGYLTVREREIVLAAATGDDNETIAAALFISPLTVKTHLARAMQKMQARDRAQLVAFAYRSGRHPLG
ncbi:MAG: response regulator transcription factor [Curtobacterium sp.]